IVNISTFPYTTLFRSEHGVKALDYFFSGHRTMMFSEKVETPEDIKGLTLRVTPSPALEDWYRSLGASPESISLPDVYQAAQTGVIDGMEMDLDAAVTSNFNEVTGYGAMTNHMVRSEEHRSELQSRFDLVCRLLLE